MTPRPRNALRLRRLGIDTLLEPVIYLRAESLVCRSEGFEAQARLLVERDGRSIIATLNTVTEHLLHRNEASLSESAWALIGAKDGDEIFVSHAPHLESLSYVRGKIHGKRLTTMSAQAIVQDVAAGRYSDVELAAFVAACAGDRMTRAETTALTRAMISVGDHLAWGVPMVVDKHCVGGLPGNRTTLIVVPIVAAAGLTIPKTSSRAITSPAGTADTMETLSPVNLDLATMRRVVEREGGCIAWGGAVHLSPADDILIRVERPLEIDSRGQLVASVLSKKSAAGATHVLIDVPHGPTAKIRSLEQAHEIAGDLEAVGRAIGLTVQVILTDGRQPVGAGIGPALEARDVLRVLSCEDGAPADLRERALVLAARVLEFSERFPAGTGRAEAERLLDDGSALAKLQAIGEAQGGWREPPIAALTHPVESRASGIVTALDCRRVARSAKLAGAPEAKAAGLMLHARIGDRVHAGQPVLTIHAESQGELDYALAFAESGSPIVEVAPE